MPKGSKILVVDDEQNIREMLQIGLEQNGYAVRCLPDGTDLVRSIDGWQPDAIVLDVMLPYADGFSLLPLIRRRTQAIVIMLTAKADIENRIAGLDLGADDYVPKPFAFRELVARIEASLRRPQMAAPAMLRCADLSLDLKTREVRRGDRKISLTQREFMLLSTLMREPKRVFSKEELLQRVWGVDFTGEIGNVETYISYLRSKIDADAADKLIHTTRRAGYSIYSECEAG